jgi:membrane-bound serine protease (ClpP class)
MNAAVPRRILLWLALMLLGAAVVAPVRAADPVVDVITLNGPIVPPVADWISSSLEDASERGAAAVVIELDTPGGLMTSSDQIVRSILASEVPVVVWVAPENARAASAGVFLTYAAHVAAMAPGTRIGSASPVGGDGGDLDETMGRKVTNDAVSQLRALADRRGRNADWAEQSVREAANITAEVALQIDVIDLIAPDLPALLDAIDGRQVETAAGPVVIDTTGAQPTPVQMGWMGQVLTLLATPTIAYMLLTLGGLGLFLELSQPGATIPGVAGAISLLLGLYGLGTLPVNWAGALLIGLAFVLFIADIFVPSLGTLTIGGVVAFIIGSNMLIDESAGAGLEIPQALIWGTAGLLVALGLVIGAFVAKSHLSRPATGREGLVGAIGLTRRSLDPDGMVFVGGEFWQATAVEQAPIPTNAPVAVTGIDGLRLLVRRATAIEAATAGVAILPPEDDLPGIVVPPSSAGTA